MEIIKRIKAIFFVLSIVAIISGCSYQNDNLGESGKSSSSNENETSSVIATLSIEPTVSPEKAISSSTPAVDNNEREDTPVEYVEANYFTEKVKDIIFYRDGKRYTISPDTEQGKEIIFMVKQRYVNTTERVIRQNKLKEKFEFLQKKGKALEIKFAKPCYKIYTGGKSNDYKKVSINYQSWFYPLEGKEMKYFMPLPNQECTYEKLGDAKELLDYLEKCIG